MRPAFLRPPPSLPCWRAVVADGRFARGAAAAASAHVPAVAVDAGVRARRRRAPALPGYAEAMARLRRDAAKALKAGPFTVMAKSQVPPSGDKHDYMSLARYYWPDPTKPGGLPYVQRDGETNPEIDTIPDKNQMNGMISAVSTLALAYYLTGEEPYAAKAASLVRAWYLDPETRMNPNLEFGQGVKGKEPGRADRHHRHARACGGGRCPRHAAGLAQPDGDGPQGAGRVARRVPRLAAAKPPGPRRGGRHQQPRRVVRRAGGVAGALHRAHRTWPGAILEAARAERIGKQIEPDGSMPRELARTTSAGYTQFNLEAFAALAALGETRRRRSLAVRNARRPQHREGAVAFVLPFVRDGRPWTHKQIKAFDPATYYPLFVAAAPHYPNLKLLELADRLGGPAARSHRANLRFGRPAPAEPHP